MIKALQVKDPIITLADVASRRKKSTWGGYRKGAGRKPELEDPHRYSMDFEGPQMAALEEIGSERGVSIATVVRDAVAEYVARWRRK
jgi:hypothetical protein